MNDDALNLAIKCTAIQDVYLKESTAKNFPGFDPKYGKHKLLVQLKHSALSAEKLSVKRDGEQEEHEILKVLVSTGMRLIDQNIPDEFKDKFEKSTEYVRAEVTAIFIAEYRITCDEITKEAIDEFSKRNAGFHVWPYWREYVQSTCSRLRLPQVVLPMYTLPH
jgi:hypothetical protein